MPYGSDILATSGLIAYWRLGETGATAADSAGSSPGSYVGSPSRGVTGLVFDSPADGAVDLNGTSQLVSIPNTTAINIGAPITLEAWVKFDAFSATLNNTVMYHGTGGAGASDSYYMTVTANGASLQSGHNWNDIVTAYSFSTATTYHLVHTYDGSFLRQYINGNLVGTLAYSTAISTSAQALSLGNYASGGNQWVNGVIDEVAIYNRALSDAEIQAHWRAGNPSAPGVPTSVHVSPDTLTSVTVAWTAPVDNGGLAITGYTVTPYIGAVAQTPIAAGTGTSYTVTGLTLGETYTFTVKAANAFATGAESAPSSAFTMFDNAGTGIGDGTIGIGTIGVRSAGTPVDTATRAQATATARGTTIRVVSARAQATAVVRGITPRATAARAGATAGVRGTSSLTAGARGAATASGRTANAFVFATATRGQATATGRGTTPRITLGRAAATAATRAIAALFTLFGRAAATAGGRTGSDQAFRADTATRASATANGRGTSPVVLGARAAATAAGKGTTSKAVSGRAAATATVRATSPRVTAARTAATATGRGTTPATTGVRAGATAVGRGATAKTLLGRAQATAGGRTANAFAANADQAQRAAATANARGFIPVARATTARGASTAGVHGPGIAVLVARGIATASGVAPLRLIVFTGRAGATAGTHPLIAGEPPPPMRLPTFATMDTHITTALLDTF